MTTLDHQPGSPESVYGTLYIAPAEPGRVWKLARFTGRAVEADIRKPAQVGYFRDPLVGLAAYAGEIRGRWGIVAAVPGIPAVPPTDDQLAINMYLLAGQRSDLPTGNYYLAKVWADEAGTDINTASSGRDHAAQRYILSDAWDEWTCLCGNGQEDGDGFHMVDDDGESHEGDRPWTGGYVCNTCDRRITAPHGATIAPLSGADPSRR
ncbi:hypothetical protein [Catellatospora sp. NPDC049133]|uniref:hypothetical protein n=1 Tax=Catellatospora sp. NPDC049133 TaxID=3155499 RepID=UPI0033CFA8BD